MSLVGLIVTIAVLGLLLWAINQIPMEPTIKKILNVVAIVVVCLWVLQAVGLLGDVNMGMRLH
jgi:heme A synthase